MLMCFGTADAFGLKEKPEIRETTSIKVVQYAQSLQVVEEDNKDGWLFKIRHLTASLFSTVMKNVL